MLPFFRRLTSTFAVWALVLLCLFSFLMMLWAARTDSAIDDELAHIPAGYGYVHNLDYRLNPEHPPLVKALAMLPVLFLRPTPVFSVSSPAWTTAVNGQWDMGRAFLYGTIPAGQPGAGQPLNDATAIIQWARLMPILLAILTIIFVFLLARRLLGPLWALLPATLFALDPTVLAHGHYVTTDIGATFGIVFATYFFLRFLEESGNREKEIGRRGSFFHFPFSLSLLWAGLAFGVAMITKFSTPFLIPIFLLVALLMGIIRKMPMRMGIFTLAIFVIGYILVVYPVYALFTAHYPIAKQVSDTTNILTSFFPGSILHHLADLDLWAAHNPVLRPFAEYLLGLLMVLQRSAGNNTIYFLGHVVQSGGWIYFPLLFLLKEPLPTLAIILIALGLALAGVISSIKRLFQSGSGKLKRAWRLAIDWLQLNTAEFTMASFIVLYWGYSMRSPLNIGIRHILPTLPFIYILAAGAWKKWMLRFDMPLGLGGGGAAGATGNVSPFMNPFDMLAVMKRSLARVALKYALLVALVVWLLAETVFAAPYFLSYFNEFGGGVDGGYHYVTDSNYDWGQDLLRLQTWMAAHPKVDRIAVDYFGGGDPNYYLNSGANAGRETDWSPSKGNPTDQGIHWLAISINQLEGATQPPADGTARAPQDSYAWLAALRPPAPGMGNVPPPDERVGTTLFIYHL